MSRIRGEFFLKIDINKIIPADNDKRVKSKAIYDENGNYIPLQDGKARWNKRKAYGVDFAKIFYEIGVDEVKKAEKEENAKFIKKNGKNFVDSPVAKKYFSKSNRMVECSCRLNYWISAEGKGKLNNASFCRDRLCPICMWRLSRRLAWETNQIVDRYMKKNPNMVPIMLGLTVLNPKMGELSKMLDVLCHGKSGAWQLLLKWLGRRGIKDYIRTIEVTFNCKELSWHPHIHALCFVPKEYFLKSNKDYISQVKLAEYWQRACNLDYKPIVDIRRVYDKNLPKERIKVDSDIKAIDLTGAIFETAKYCVKPLNLFSNYSDDGSEKFENNISMVKIKDVVRELSEALAGRRLRAFGGELKTTAKELKFDDDESKKDLIHNDENSITEAVWEAIYEYVFEDRDYYLTAYDEMNQEREDKEKFDLDTG